MMNYKLIDQGQGPFEDQIIMIVDRSGSMQIIREDAEGGVNSFIAEQKKIDKPTKFTLTQFDNVIEKFENVDIRCVKGYYLRPRGMTALYDAIGKTLSEFNEKVAGKVYVVICTDGMENASREYNQKTVKSLIDEKTKEGWEFVWLSADLDAIGEAGKIGIGPDTVIDWDKSKGIADAYGATAAYVSNLRSTGDKTLAKNALDGAKASSDNLK